MGRFCVLIFLAFVIALTASVCYADDKLVELRRRAELEQEQRSNTGKRQGTSCPNDCSGNGRCMGRDCACNSGYSGADCSIRDTAIALNQVVTGDVGLFEWQYYHVALRAGQGFVVQLNQTSRVGDCDVYVLKGDFPTLTRYYAKDVSMSSSVTLPVRNATAGTWYVGVYGFFACSYALALAGSSACPQDCSGHGSCGPSGACACDPGFFGPACSAAAAPLQPGAPLAGAAAAGQWAYYSYAAAAGARLQLDLQETSAGLNDDCDLYAAFARPPTLQDFDLANDTKDAHSTLVVPATPRAGTWFVGVYGYTGCQFSLTLAAAAAPCPNNCSLRGQCGAAGCACPAAYNGSACEFQLQPLRVNAPASGFVSPGAWNYYSFRLDSASPVVLSVTQQGGDCDLYVRANALPTRLAFDAFNIDTAASFNVTLDSPGSATWYVGVYGWSGASRYQIALGLRVSCACGPHGQCASGNAGVCVCQPGWGGPACDLPLLPLQSGAAASGSLSAGQFAYYYFTTPNTSVAVITLLETQTTGMLWLYADLEQAPTMLSHDYASKTAGVSLQELAIKQSTPDVRTYYIGVYGNPFAVQGSPLPYSLVAWAPDAL